MERDKKEEILQLNERRERLRQLITSAIKRVVTSEDASQAQEGVYELLFFDMADRQLASAQERLRGFDDFSEGETEFATEQGQLLENIIQNGDWKQAKITASTFIATYLEDPLEDEDMGVSEDYVFKGEKLIAAPGETSNYPLVEEFVWTHLDFIPNRTKPYQHPNLETLKSQVAFNPHD